LTDKLKALTKKRKLKRKSDINISKIIIIIIIIIKIFTIYILNLSLFGSIFFWIFKNIPKLMDNFIKIPLNLIVGPTLHP